MTTINDLAIAWRKHCMRSLTEMPDLLRRILEELEDLGYAEKDLFGIRLAIEEALVNAVKHGNRGDSAKLVRVRYQAAEDQFMIEIEDEGPGFRPEEVPDPLAPENFERACGRGLLLMEHYMTWVQYNDAGNGVTLCKIIRA
jgi:serine/threonine-protein kinase RsbW